MAPEVETLAPMVQVFGGFIPYTTQHQLILGLILWSLPVYHITVFCVFEAPSKWIDDHVTPGGEVAWQVPELNGPIWRVIAGIIIQ